MATFWSTYVSSSSAQPGWQTPSLSDIATAPAALNPNKFRTWTLAKQIEYINANGSGTPKSVEIGPEGDRVTVSIAANARVQLKVGSASGEAFTSQNPGRTATAEELATDPDELSTKTFLAWQRADQLAYVTAQGSPVTIGTSTDIPKIHAELAEDVQMDAGVIRYSSGDFEPIPYFNLTGSSAGATPIDIKASAEALFPTLDGDEHTLPVEDRPPEFYTPPSALTTDAQKMTFLESFSKWHSAYQLEYVKTHGTGGVLDIQVSDPPARLTAAVSVADGTKLFILQALDKNAFAKMSYAEQVQMTGLPGFAEMATKLGLDVKTAAVVTDVTSTSNPPASVSAATAVENLIDYINDHAPDTPARVKLDSRIGGSGFNPNTDYANSPGVTWVRERTIDNGILPDTYEWVMYYQAPTPPSMPATDRAYFTAQLAILQEQLGKMGVVSGQDIAKKISELKERFDRACAFYEINPPARVAVYMGNPPSYGHIWVNTVSVDGDLSGIRRGYQTFIAQEKRIAELTEARMQLVRDNGVLFGKNLDVPYLVYKFQSLYNLQLEAQVVMETEEINQQNDLLKTYARMQDVVNKTLSMFAKTDEDGRIVLGYNVDAMANSSSEFTVVSEEDRYILSMFEDVVGAGQSHPLEKLRNIKRPIGEIFGQFDSNSDRAYDLKSRTHPQWSTFGTRLSETVTLINQNSQLKMNDVNSMDKQRNRHFELANNALSKMAEMIQTIARS